MKESKAKPNRIPAAEGQAWEPWTMPVIGDDEQVLSVQKTSQQDSESIEEVDLQPDHPSQALTAEQLAEIVQEAEKEGFAKGCEEGLKQGYDEGFKSGQQQGLLEMRQQLTAEQKTFQSLAASLFEPIEQQDELLEAMLLATIERLTRAVVMKELATDRGDLIALVRQAVAALPRGRERIAVHLNPEDLPLVETYCQEHGLDWSFHPDPDVGTGGVKVVTDDSTVDFTVERRLEDIIDSFLNQQNVDENTPDDTLVQAYSEALNKSQAPEQSADTAEESEIAARPADKMPPGCGRGGRQ